MWLEIVQAVQMLKLYRISLGSFLSNIRHGLQSVLTKLWLEETASPLANKTRYGVAQEDVTNRKTPAKKFNFEDDKIWNRSWNTRDGRAHPLSVINHSPTYTASICNLIKYCLSPTLNVGQNQLRENAIQLRMLVEEAKRLEVELLDRGSDSHPAFPPLKYARIDAQGIGMKGFDWIARYLVKWRTVTVTLRYGEDKRRLLAWSFSQRILVLLYSEFTH